MHLRGGEGLFIEVLYLRRTTSAFGAIRRQLRLARQAGRAGIQRDCQ
jgi:hypothetical protein